MRGAGIRETERLEALRALDILDSAPDAEIDRVARLAAELFGVPVALITITDAKRNWFKARFGTELGESPRDISFCTHAIQGEELFEVPDLSADPRFADNPLVTGPLHVRYYAGAVLRVGGHALGTLCLYDFAPRAPLSEHERQSLEGLAELAVLLIEARQLRRASAAADAVARATPDAIVCADMDGIITQWNPGAEALFGHTAPEAIGKPIEIIIPVRDLRATGATHDVATGEKTLVGKTLEVPAIHRDGSQVPVEISLAGWSDGNSKPAGFGAIMRDLRPRKAAERQGAETRRLMNIVIENLPATLFVKDAQTGRYLFFNRAGEEATGMSAEAIVGHTDAELWPELAEGYADRDAAVLATGETQTYESEHLRPDGEARVMRTRRVVVPDASGKARYLLGISEDVTGWRRAQERLAFVAGHDLLTGLHNRDHFTRELDARLPEEGEVALLALDLDRFSSLNEVYGREAADGLLTSVAAEVRRALKPGESAARFDADRFFIMVAGKGAGRRAEAIARELLARLTLQSCGTEGGPQARADRGRGRAARRRQCGSVGRKRRARRSKSQDGRAGRGVFQVADRILRTGAGRCGATPAADRGAASGSDRKRRDRRPLPTADLDTQRYDHRV